MTESKLFLRLHREVENEAKADGDILPMLCVTIGLPLVIVLVVSTVAMLI